MPIAKCKEKKQNSDLRIKIVKKAISSHGGFCTHERSKLVRAIK